MRIMLPMITSPSEIEAVRADPREGNCFRSQQLERQPANPPLGIMVEVPAVAIAIELYEADFYSIGSNDLTQYVPAAARDIGAVADLADASHPAIMRLIENVARHGRKSRREVCLCGDIAGDPSSFPGFCALACGRCRSLPPHWVAPRVRSARSDLGTQPRVVR